LKRKVSGFKDIGDKRKELKIENMDIVTYRNTKFLGEKREKK